MVVFIRQALFFLLASFLFTGCATKPWSEPLGSTEADATLQLVDDLAAREAACGATLEGDLVLFYQNPLEKKALSGFLRFSAPASYKFVVSNPFGQPILAVAGNQESFQALNIVEKSYLAGSLRSFGLRNDIPSYLLKSNWAALLTGRYHMSSRAIIDIREDRDRRGVWLTLPSKGQTGVYHLLFDRDNEVVLDCILENGSGRTIAEITYENWVTVGQCKQPLDISIAGLDYGTSIQIKLANVSITNESETYHLQPPPGFRRQYMP